MSESDRVHLPVEAHQRPPARFADWDAHAAWDYDGIISVWRLERGGETRYLKVRRPKRDPYTLADERDRLLWIGDRVPVPTVIDYGFDGDLEWLLMETLPGRMAAEDELKADPEWIVPLLARGLREFHERLDVASCPFDFTIEASLAHVRRRLEAGDFDKDYDLHLEFAHMTGEQAVARLESLARPLIEDVVVCHGDYCFPNVLIDAGMIVGYLDLGELGVADRWCDIAVGAWSTTWNIGPGYEELFYESYGVDPDPERIEFYRLLYSLAS